MRANRGSLASDGGNPLHLDANGKLRPLTGQIVWIDDVAASTEDMSLPILINGSKVIRLVRFSL